MRGDRAAQVTGRRVGDREIAKGGQGAGVIRAQDGPSAGEGRRRS